MTESAELPTLHDAEFQLFRRLVQDRLGIHLSDGKQALVAGRLMSRIRLLGMRSYKDYLDHVRDPRNSEELQHALDRLTTNETSFFREADHFQILKDYVRSLRPLPVPFRIWSGAASSGEEAYTMAMVLDEIIPSGVFEITGTDISTRVLDKARSGVYPIERAEQIPQIYLKHCCQRGTGPAEGTLRIQTRLRSKVQFIHANLTEKLPAIGPFDVIFLRNVLIYFDAEIKRRVVESAMTKLKPNGLLIVGHSESLHGVTDKVRVVRPTVYVHA